MYENLALFGGFLLVYSLVAGAIERTWVSGPIVFTLFGLLVGPMFFNLHSLELNGDVIAKLAELTLALVLFTDAAGADIKVLKRVEGLPTRLLLIGLPLTILLGFGVGILLFEHQSLLMLVILATMLAPTDAALGKAVVTNKAVPVEIRESLNVESGLNDGICVPVLLLFLELALDHAGTDKPSALALTLVVEEIGIGVAVGLSITWFSVRLFRIARTRGWLNHIWAQLPVVALALTCFALAQLLGGSGFIAAFSGGLLMAAIRGADTETEHDNIFLSSEGISDALALITWVFFGSAIVGQVASHLSWSIFLYSMLSLTLVRMLPVYLSLTGSGMSAEGKLFIGWFGPRGLASIVFSVMVVNSGLPGSEPLVMTVVCTIILSIVFHGVTANPWAKAFAKRGKTAAGS